MIPIFPHYNVIKTFVLGKFSLLMISNLIIWYHIISSGEISVLSSGKVLLRLFCLIYVRYILLSNSLLKLGMPVEYRIVNLFQLRLILRKYMWLFALLVTKFIKINFKRRRLYSCICYFHKHCYLKQEIHLSL